jgi:hypothetical protein
VIPGIRGWVLRGADTTVVVVPNSGRLVVRCARIDFNVAGVAAFRAVVRAMQLSNAKVEVVVTAPCGEPLPVLDKFIRIVPDASETCVHITVQMSIPVVGEYRYVVTYTAPSDTQTQEGAVLVYSTRKELDEFRCLLRTVEFELSGVPPRFSNLTILKTDDPRTRAVLFRCKLETSPYSRAMTPAELRHTDMRARVKHEMGMVTMVIRGNPRVTTTTPRALTEASQWHNATTKSPIAVKVGTASGADSRVVAEFEVTYVDRGKCDAQYEVSYHDTVVGRGTITVEEPTKPRKRGALVLTCTDLSKIQRRGMERLMKTLGYEDDEIANYDTFSLPGASLGVVGSDNVKMVAGYGDTHSALFHGVDTYWDQTFFDQITFSANLHAIDRIVVVDHLGCSCYNEYYSDYGQDYHDTGGKSPTCINLHFQNMRSFCALLYRVNGDSDVTRVSGYLLDGSGEPQTSPFDVATNWTPQLHLGEIRYDPTSTKEAPGNRVAFTTQGFSYDNSCQFDWSDWECEWNNFTAEWVNTATLSAIGLAKKKIADEAAAAAAKDAQAKAVAAAAQAEAKRLYNLPSSVAARAAAAIVNHTAAIFTLTLRAQWYSSDMKPLKDRVIGDPPTHLKSNYSNLDYYVQVLGGIVIAAKKLSAWTDKQKVESARRWVNVMKEAGVTVDVARLAKDTGMLDKLVFGGGVGELGGEDYVGFYYAETRRMMTQQQIWLAPIEIYAKYKLHRLTAYMVQGVRGVDKADCDGM